MARRHSAVPRNRARSAVPPVAHRGASSCGDGPLTRACTKPAPCWSGRLSCGDPAGSDTRPHYLGCLISIVVNWQVALLIPEKFALVLSLLVMQNRLSWY